MTHSQYVLWAYYFLLLAAAAHVAMIAIEVHTYRVTGIKSLIPMIVANFIGLLYLVALFARNLYAATPASFANFAVPIAVLFTAEVIVAVWGVFVFFRTFRNMVAD